MARGGNRRVGDRGDGGAGFEPRAARDPSAPNARRAPGSGAAPERARGARPPSALASRALLAALVLAAAGAGGLAGWRRMASADELRIRAIEFSGLARASEDELLALSPVKPGDHLLLADLGAAERALARHPWAREVEASRRLFPPRLEVRIRERTAVALVDLGGLYLVDAAGEVFKRATPGDGLDLPVVTGLSRAEFVGTKGAVDPLLGRALTLVMAWREDDRDARSRLSEIHVEGEELTVYVGEEGTQVRLGSGDLPAKLSRMEKVLAALRAEGVKAEVLHLDNRLHPSWVTVRLAMAGAGSGSPGAGARADGSGRARPGSAGGRGPASPVTR